MTSGIQAHSSGIVIMPIFSSQLPESSREAKTISGIFNSHTTAESQAPCAHKMILSLLVIFKHQKETLI